MDRHRQPVAGEHVLVHRRVDPHVVGVRVPVQLQAYGARGGLAGGRAGLVGIAAAPGGQQPGRQRQKE